MGKPDTMAHRGATVKELAELFAHYAKENPGAVVRFTSNESGGKWPAGRTAMGVFVDDQATIVDATRCGGGITFGVSLMAFGKD